MNQNQSEVLQQLAERLGTSVEYLWSVLVKQAYIAAATNAVWLIVVGLLVVATYRAALRYSVEGKALRDERGPFSNHEIPTLVSILLAVLCVALGLLFTNIVVVTITALANPEYWALQQILSAFD